MCIILSISVGKCTDIFTTVLGRGLERDQPKCLLQVSRRTGTILSLPPYSLEAIARFSSLRRHYIGAH